jgi:hypothetical protein
MGPVWPAPPVILLQLQVENPGKEPERTDDRSSISDYDDDQPECHDNAEHHTFYMRQLLYCCHFSKLSRQFQIAD